MFISFLLIASSYLSSLVSGHGRLLRPPSRSSIWRFKEYETLDPPKNYNDMELFCGGIHQKENPGENCGVCGDKIQAPKPRDNEYGGLYWRGIITGNYTKGQVIEVEVEITAEHGGFMEFRLCTNPFRETQKCFNKNLLERENGHGSKVQVSRTGMYLTKLRLPNGVNCSRCSLQWNYRAGNNWGQCKNGTSRVGCGPQETFRGCADISVNS